MPKVGLVSCRDRMKSLIGIVSNILLQTQKHNIMLFSNTNTKFK